MTTPCPVCGMELPLSMTDGPVHDGSMEVRIGLTAAALTSAATSRTATATTGNLYQHPTGRSEQYERQHP